MNNNRPNVILVVPHDLGDYLACYGHTANTPNIDKLAAEGVMFTNHFCTSPFCSPARGSIITGMYPHTNGLMGLTNLGWDMPEGTVTDAMRFKQAGYQTYLIGFQHEMGDFLRLGFEHNIEVGYVPCEVVATKAVEVLEALPTAENQSPFYMRLGMRETHRLITKGQEWPYGFHEYESEGIPADEVEISPNWRDTPELRRDLTGFTGSVHRLDTAVGRVLDTLEKTGLAENTIVVFTADHGIDFPRAKTTLYDQGIRTALIVRYPNGFAGGRQCSVLTSHIDILPTLLDCCEAPPVINGEGLSLMPLLKGEDKLARDCIFAEESVYPRNLMRCVRTSQYKYIRNYCPGEASRAFGMPGAPLLAPDTDAYMVTVPEVELYDVIADPCEINNLADIPEMQEVKNDLEMRLLRWMQGADDPLLTGTIQRPDNEADIFRSLPLCFTSDKNFMDMTGVLNYESLPLGVVQKS